MVPPAASEHASTNIRNDIPPITYRVVENMRPGELEQKGPDEQMKTNLAPCRGVVHGSKSQLLLQPEQWR